MLSTKLKEAAGNSADATLYVDDVFSTWLTTGAGASITVNNGIDLAGKGGMVWNKTRSTTGYNTLFDTARGVNNGLFSNTTNAQSTTADWLPSFNSNGFTIGTSNNLSTSGTTGVSWTFRKAPKFFDVVTYTGTGSARTIAHSLGIAPGMVIVKRTDTSSDWQVYHRSLTSAANSIQLNLTNAQASAPTVWNSTAPTSSVFSVGTDASVNASGGTYVAYLYAHDTSSTGIIQCGSYVGNGATAGPNITLGWEPQFVLRKNISNARGGPDGNGSWDICDSMRGMSQTSCPFLLANSSAAEDTSTVTTGFIIPNATGFVDTYTYPGDSYIYMAIRMPNKPPTTGTQVFSPYTRAGNNTVTTVSGLDFSPDMVMGNSRESGYYPGWTYDRLRGTNAGYILTPSTAAEYYDSSTTITISGVQNAYILPTSNPNRSAATAGYVDYRFKRAPGFFDEVCYTGDGANPQYLTHNLGVEPELIIFKNRSASQDWFVSYTQTGIGIKLNSSASQLFAGTPMTVGPTLIAAYANIYSGAWTTNTTSNNYVAYLFATLAGISKVGSYTGNGTGQAIACGFSAGARFVLIKRTDSTGDWYTFDSARGLTSGSSPYLLLNSTAAEVTGNNGVYASTGGFTLGSTASTTTNISGASYIYLSVA